MTRQVAHVSFARQGAFFEAPICQIDDEASKGVHAGFSLA